MPARPATSARPVLWDLYLQHMYMHTHKSSSVFIRAPSSKTSCDTSH